MLQDSADDGYYFVVIAPCNHDIIGPIERVDTVDYNHRHKLRIRIFRLCSQAAETQPPHPQYTHNQHSNCENWKTDVDPCIGYTSPAMPRTPCP